MLTTPRPARDSTEASLEFAAFGCALDALDSPERVAMKLAYLGAVETGLVTGDVPLDPYDLIIETLTLTGRVRAAGKVQVPSWLTPRPRLEDGPLIDPASYRDFAEAGGLERVSSEVAAFTKERVLPDRPILISADHSTTGGVLDAVRESRDLALIILDAHLDAISAETRRLAAGSGGDPLLDAYDCGTWLMKVIERGVISPDRLVVLGVSDHPGGAPKEDEPRGMAAYREAYLAIEREGASIVTKGRLRDEGAPALEAALKPLEGLDYYVSIDADVAAGPSVKAVRFMDTIGLEPGELLDCASAISRVLGTQRLSGMDISEVDVHLADIPGGDDRTIEVMARAALELIGAA